MIRTNLSTRPFYNERAVHIWLAVIALAVVAATAFNVSRVLKYSRSDTQLAQQADRDEARATDLRTEATRLRASVDPRQVDLASAEARQANELIDRRTFSWTELFNRFETTLPDDVRITSVRPKIDEARGFVVVISVVARNVDDVSLFMENLEKTGAFSSLLSREDHFNDQGLLESTLETTYALTAPRPPGRRGAARR
jgi:type IV pilus assembly protein PilN